MEQSIGSLQNTNYTGIDPTKYEMSLRPVATNDAGRPEIVRYQTASWHGLHAKTVQIINLEPFEYRFKQQCHLLIAIEQGIRHDGETLLEGLPKSTIRRYSNTLILVPAGRTLYGVQNPRLLPRSICLYIDPKVALVDPDLRFAEVELQPRLLFEDPAIWETVLKLKAQIGSTDPSDRMYADALGGVLAHELLRLNGGTSTSGRGSRGGLVAWQQRRVLEFMEEHLAEDFALGALADLVRLSPYHFVRSFKRSIGEPPHRYWVRRRIERAKTLLANPSRSVTEIAFDVGFGGSSAFSVAFRRITGRTPTEFRRSFE